MLFPTLENAIWVSTAKLHYDTGAREIPVQQIKASLAALFPKQAALRSVSTYLSQVLIATKKRFPNHLNSRILVGSGPMRRLFRTGDPVHSDRADAKYKPSKREIPEAYWHLLDWYDEKYNAGGSAPAPSCPRAVADGSGKNWLRFVGYINAHDLALMKKAIEEDFEKVYPE